MNARASADELAVGTLFPLARVTVTEAEIISFARDWDPQAFHIDPHSQAASRFGGVIASGIHTLAIFMRLGAGVYDQWDVVAGRALRDVEYVRPVLSGTPLSGTIEIIRIDHYSSTRSLVVHRGTLRGDDGDAYVTLTLEAVVMRGSIPASKEKKVG